MASKPKTKMPVSERAKQFMPFSALKGLDEALKAKEYPYSEWKEPDEQQAEDINQKLHLLKPHDEVAIVFYFSGRYFRLEGALESLDTALRTLKVGSVEIFFDEIIEIEIKENYYEKD